MNFQVSGQGSLRQRPQGSFLVPSVDLGCGPGSVAVMVPEAESQGLLVWRGPLVSLGVLTWEKILWRSEERVELWRKFEGEWYPLGVGQQHFLFCFSGQTLILFLFSLWQNVFSHHCAADTMIVIEASTVYMLWMCTHSLDPSGFDVCDYRCCGWERHWCSGLEASLSIDLLWRTALSALPCGAGSFLPEVGSGHALSGLKNLSRFLEAQNVLVRALASGKSTLRDGGPRSVLAQAVRPIWCSRFLSASAKRLIRGWF